MNLNAELQQLLSEIRMEKRTIRNELIKYPQGKLSLAKQNGRPQLMLSSYVNGKRKRKTVPEGTDAFKEMLRRELLSRKLAALEGNCSVLEYALNNLQDHSRRNVCTCT